MKRILFALQLAMLLLSIPVAMNAEDVQKVYLNKGFLDGAGWYDYSLEMGHKSADYIYSYTFNSGDLGEGKTGEPTYFRIKIVRENKTFIIAPKEENSILEEGKYTDANVYTLSESVKVEGINNSYQFTRKSNTTYTIRLKWNYFDGEKYTGLKVAYYEGAPAPSSVEGYPSRPRLISDNEAFNNKAFTKAGPSYYYYDIDLSDEKYNGKDLNFKFYTIADKEYIGCDYKGFKEVDKFSFDKFYWPSNELGPDSKTSDDGWRNEYFTLKHSTSGIKKYRINLWRETREEIGGARKWKFYVQNMDMSPDDELYFVSPELTGNKRLPEFRMSPSRRCDVDVDGDGNGNYDEVLTHWSFNLPDFVLKNKGLDEIHYHIETANGEIYSIHSVSDQEGNGYELGFVQEKDRYPSTDIQLPTTDLPNDYNREEKIIKNIGNVVRYERYDAMPNAELNSDGTAKYNFCLKRSGIRDKAKNGTSYTWLFNRLTRSLGIYVNTENFGKDAADANGYYLVGNFNAADDTNPYDLHIEGEDYHKKMSKSWYIGGESSTTKIADADSIVYSVTINKPAKGWKKGGYTMVVAPSAAIEESMGNGEKDWGKIWAQVIRPQERCDYFYRSEALAPGYKEMSEEQQQGAIKDLKERVSTNWKGLNATALHGGLYARKAEQTDNVQQMIMVFPNEGTNSFTFYMNLKTSTYYIKKEENLFIMGPAVGTKDDDRSSNGWSNENATIQTDHAYKLTYNEAGYYTYVDNYGKEAPVPMAAGYDFAFKVNKSDDILYYAEDGVVPKSLINEKGKSVESTDYSKIDGDDKANTQYVNFLTTGKTGDGNTFKACTFGLPSKKGANEGYYIRLYANGTAGNGTPFYTIRRAYTFSTPLNPKNTVSDESAPYKSFKTFSDYHAVELPEGVDAFYISEADPASRTAKLVKYPCRLAYGKNVLPAGAAVILATKDEADTGSGSILKLDKDMDYFYEPNFKESDYDKTPANMLKSQITCTMLPYENDVYANFLFSFQKKYDSDTQSTIGFFKAGKAKNPINTAYLQVPSGFLTGSSQSVKGWTISFDFNDDEITGIMDVEVENAKEVPQGYYTLQGVKIDKPLTKGIYIHCGKKIIIK